jgi:hypothetical protein
MSAIRLLIPLAVALVLGCSSHEELPPPDNPFDPGNPDYVSPTVQIINGPSESEIVEAARVTFEWQGNESATEYSFQFDGSDWSEWSTNTSGEFDYLDEGDHLFRVRARSMNGDSQETPTMLSFVVDAVPGSSALVCPYKQPGSLGDTLIYQIVAEDVTDLFAVEINISIDNEYLELIEVIDGDLFNELGGEVLRIQEVNESHVSLSVVAVEGASNSFSGTTSILSLRVLINATVDLNTTMDVIDLVNVVYLNPEMESITLMESREGVLSYPF